MSSVNSLCTIHVQFKIANTPCSFLVDTGAAVTLINKTTWQHCLPPNQYKLEPWTGHRLIGVESSPLQVLGQVSIPIEIDSQVFNVAVVVVNGISETAILGLDFLADYQCHIDIETQILVKANSCKLEKHVPHPIIHNVMVW